MSRAWVRVPHDLSGVHDELLLTGEQWDAISSLPEENESGVDERQQALARSARAQLSPFDFSFGEPVHKEGPS
jgi:hypothetical protein